jgi:hypothetical protein
MNQSLMNRGMLICAHIADIHFSAFDPKEQYEILKEQFISVIDQFPRLDIISIDGDIYHHKLMGNSDGLYYASLFVDDVMGVARRHNSTVIMIHGTYSHDADQLKNFYHYLNDYDVDVRICTTIQFEEIKGAKILCIPELYGLDESIYQQFLHYSGYYDEAFMHGTFKGAVYKDTVGNGRLFTPQDFNMCTGFMIGGHVHTPGCHSGYFYYTGSPYRWKFGEEEDKGFLITIHDLDTNRHYVHFQKIISNSYITIDMKEIDQNDPKTTIEKINRIKTEKGIDFLKIRFSTPVTGPNKTIIENYYRNNATTFVEFLDVMEERRLEQERSGKLPDEYDFILDNSISDLEKFVRYVNIKEGSEFITVDKLKSILEEQI